MSKGRRGYKQRRKYRPGAQPTYWQTEAYNQQLFNMFQNDRAFALPLAKPAGNLQRVLSGVDAAHRGRGHARVSQLERCASIAAGRPTGRSEHV